MAKKSNYELLAAAGVFSFQNPTDEQKRIINEDFTHQEISLLLSMKAKMSLEAKDPLIIAPRIF